MCTWGISRPSFTPVAWLGVVVNVVIRVVVIQKTGIGMGSVAVICDSIVVAVVEWYYIVIVVASVWVHQGWCWWVVAAALVVRLG
jgi:hypothetical protein